MTNSIMQTAPIGGPADDGFSDSYCTEPKSLINIHTTTLGQRIFLELLIMVTLCNTADHYIFDL